jgi:hypothetical protein
VLKQRPGKIETEDVGFHARLRGDPSADKEDETKASGNY